MTAQRVQSLTVALVFAGLALCVGAGVAAILGSWVAAWAMATTGLALGGIRPLGDLLWLGVAGLLGAPPAEGD